MRSLAPLLIAAVFSVAQPAFAENEDTAQTAVPEVQVASLVLPSLVGMASWYGGHHAGRKTASGEIHSTHLRTAAHRDLPLGTIVRVTNLKNGRSALVKVNDRGPFVAGRIIDLSEQAARDLSMLEDGLASVRLDVVSQ